MIPVEPVSLEEAQAAALGVVPPGAQETTPTRDQVIAEYLRFGLSSLARVDGTQAANEPVYVTRLLNFVKHNLGPLWPELDPPHNQSPSRLFVEKEADCQPDSVRRVLETLADLGDVAHVGNGYWLPTPLRLVPLGNGHGLIIGGLSTRDMRDALQMTVRLAWIARTVRIEEIPGAKSQDPSFTQDRESWLGEEVTDLRAWIKRMVTEAKRGFRQSASNLVDFLAYCPNLRPRDAQHFRWLNAKDLRGEFPEPTLCRSGGWGRPVSYWFAKLQRRGAEYVCVEECPVDYMSSRRLQYGLDLLAGAPTRVQLTSSGKGRSQLSLRNWLPSRERRLLIALARDCSPNLGQFPMVFEIADEFLSVIRTALEALGIAVDAAPMRSAT